MPRRGRRCCVTCCDQGYFVPYILHAIKNIGLQATREVLARRMVDESRFNLGLDVVTADKVDAYSDFLGIIDARP